MRFMGKSVTFPSSHLSALSARHADLEARIAREETRPRPDGALLAQLKKAKLKIKDLMA
jgi:hypothetical protein